jgi:hypothetical protein
MTIMNGVRSAAVLVLALGLAACADSSAPDTPPTADLPPEAGALVLRVEHVGGFTTPEFQAGRLPLVSVYADGRVIVEGPVPAIYPAFAWPNVQVLEIGRDRVQELVDRALTAGVGETADLGTPPLADVPSTRFTLVTARETHVREVYGLSETAGMPDTGLSAEQEAARQELADLFGDLTDLGVLEAGDEPPASYAPEAVAAIVRPWTASEEDIAQGLAPDPVPWPGPALPGEELGAGLSCVVATGEQATAVRAAAGNANALTPWSSGDSPWSVTFRPLLPDESGCADLTD